MGLRIIYSDSIEALTRALAAESTCGEGDALLAAPSRIMVPNANVEKWLKMQLAEANGVAMNLVFPYLERGLWELTAQAAGPDAGHPQATSAEQSRFAVAAGLIARLEQQEQDNPLVDFCLGQEATFSRLNPNQVRRVWQLSTDLSRLFREYEYHRGLSTLPTRATLAPGMANDRDLVGFWSHPDNDLGDPPDCLLPERITGGRRQRMRQIFGAQGALYQEAVSALAQGTPAAISLPTLARGLDWNRAGDTLPRQPVRIFGVSQLSPFHCWLLHQLGRHLDIHLYHFNLCREFWEDIETPRELRHRICATTITADELDLSIENPLLNAWGKGGRETIRLLGGIEDSGSAQFTGLPCPTPRAESVLGLVQEGIGTRRANLQAPAADDATLELLACPSLRREVETVYNHIISSMSADPTLRQNDIAVLVPKMDSYRAIFESTFKARESLHFNLVDSHAGNDSVLGKGIQAALALVGSPFTRRAVFSVLANPCVLAAARASRDDLEHWGAWAEALGIFHHYDADHKAQAGIPPSSHHTWQQGLRRLRLGRVMDELPTSPQLADYPGHADMFTAGRALDRFSVLVERLYRRLQLLQQPRTPEQWLDELMRLVDDFFLIPRELPQEELVLRALRTALRDFAGQGNQMGFGAHLTRAGCREQRLPLEWIRQLMDESLASIPSGHGSYLSDGITIAALLPMRPIAFRRVYILGLEEGAFPGQDTTSTLDLRSCRRRVGDTSRSDVGRYIFLETLMATGERLCLSYVGRDLKKDEERQPCSVVLQLKAFIDQHVGADAGWSWQPRSVPLNSYSLSFAPGQTATPAEGPPQWDLAAQLLAAAVHSDDTDDTWQQELATQPLSRRQRAAAEAAQRARQPRTPAEALADDADEAAVVVTIDQLATFIKDPAEAILRYRYRLRADEEADPAVAEDEPLTTGFPDNYRLQGEALRAAFIAGEPEAGCDHLEAAYATRIRGSAAVEDPFVPFDLNDLQKSITDCCGRTSPFTLLGTLALRAEEPDDATRALELTTAGGHHVSLCCKPRELTILSRSEEWQAGYLTVQAGAKPKGKGLPAKLLPAFLALCHEIAALEDQPDTARQRHLYAAYKARKGLTAYSLNITPQQARLYLENLVDDFLGTSACELLPYGLLQKRFFHTAVDPAAVTRSALQEAFEQDQTGGFASYRLPGIVALNRDRLSVPPHPAQLVERRLTWPLASAELTVKKGGAT